MKIQFIRTHSAARTPYRKYDTDAGWDLYVCDDKIIAPGHTVDVHTNVRIRMPEGLFARIVGRSSTLRLHGLVINEGIIDTDYTGELFICVHNVGSIPFHAVCGMRLAQIIFQRVESAEWTEVEEFIIADDTRGTAGFGSTGV